MASKSLIFEIFGKDVSASKSMTNIGKSVNGLKKSFLGLGAAVGVAFTMEKVVEFGKASVDAFLGAEAEQAKLSDAFKRFPALADVSRASLDKLNKTLELKSGYDDDAIASAEGILAGFKLTGTQITKLIPLVVDYAKKTGMDVPSAASNIGKALLGNTRALKTVGIEFKKTGDTANDVTTIMGLLQTKVGGFAANEATTAAGKAAILAAKFKDIKEKVGAALYEGFKPFADWATSDSGTKTITGLADGIGSIATAIAKTPNPIATMITGVGLLAGAFWGLDAAMDANPIGLIVLGIEAIIAVVAVLSTNFGGITQDLFNFSSSVLQFALGIGQSIAGVFDGLANGVIGSLQAMLGPTNAIRAAVGLGAITLPKSNMKGVLAYDAAAYNASQSWANTTIFGVGGGYGSTGSGKGGTVGTGTRKPFAEGGIVRATPGGVNINGKFAEAGHDELIMPLTKKNMASLGGGGSTINIYEVTDPVGTANAVVRRLNMARA